MNLEREVPGSLPSDDARVRLESCHDAVAAATAHCAAAFMVPTSSRRSLSSRKRSPNSAFNELPNTRPDTGCLAERRISLRKRLKMLCTVDHSFPLVGSLPFAQLDGYLRARPVVSQRISAASPRPRLPLERHDEQRNNIAAVISRAAMH